MNDIDIVREALSRTKGQFGMQYPAAEVALDRIEADLARKDAALGRLLKETQPPVHRIGTGTGGCPWCSARAALEEKP